MLIISQRQEIIHPSAAVDKHDSFSKRNPLDKRGGFRLTFAHTESCSVSMNHRNAKIEKLKKKIEISLLTFLILAGLLVENLTQSHSPRFLYHDILKMTSSQ